MNLAPLRLPLCLALWVGLASCRKRPVLASPSPAPLPAPVPVPPPPPPAFEAQGVVLGIQADPELNLVEGRPHTLFTVVYQLSAPNAFNALAKDPVGLQTLLQGAAFDPTVVSVDRFFLQPGESRRLPLDRAQNGCWLAVAAGYFARTPGSSTRILELPAQPLTRAVPWREVTLRCGRAGLQDLSLQRPGQGVL